MLKKCLSCHFVIVYVYLARRISISSIDFISSPTNKPVCVSQYRLCNFVCFCWKKTNS